MMTASNTNQEKNLEKDFSIRNYSKYWPHTSDYLQATLDPELIETHGVAILLRSLNNGRAIGFLGSGVSMAYGRLGWGALVRHLVELATEKTSPATNEAPNSPQQISAQKEILRIQKTLKDLDLLNRPEGTDLQSGRYPAAFQFLELIFLAKERAGESVRFNNFREMVKDSLNDDKKQAHLLLRSLFFDLKKIITKNESSFILSDKIKKTAQLLENEIIDTGGSIPASWINILNLTSDGENIKSTGNKDYILDAINAHINNNGVILPSQRFVGTVAARLRYDRMQESLQKITDENFHKSNFTNSHSVSEEKILKRPGLRTNVIPPEKDPLAILADKLGIRRFLTTNYDLDIERLLADRGFVVKELPGSEKDPHESREGRDPLGSRAREAVFNAKHAADLIDFTLRDDDRSFDLVHLHGRATKDNQMIVTENDYQQLYLREDENSELVNNALHLAFGSNPVIFVGNGMSEDDVLRPLRHFVTERSSIHDRQAVVLLPALGTRAQEIEEKIALYSRYGVYTIHFGHAKCDGNNIRWLEDSIKLKNLLYKLFSEVLKIINKRSKSNFNQVIKIFKSEPKTIVALVGSISGLINTACTTDIDGEKNIAGVTYPKLEISLLLAVYKTWGDIKSQSTRDPEKIITFYPEISACLCILKHVTDSMVGASLCAKLHSLHKEWIEWKISRRQLPERKNPVGQTNHMKLVGSKPIKILHRHPISLKNFPEDGQSSQNQFHSIEEVFCNDAPSRTIQTLLAALDDSMRQYGFPGKNFHAARRIYVMLAPRGIGKGHFFESMRRKEYILQFADKAWGLKNGPNYAACAFINLSFSHEVASSFDKLSNFLVDTASEVFENLVCNKIRSVSDSLQNNRVAKLSRILELLSKFNDEKNKQPQSEHSDYSPRILVVINGFNVLFDRNGNSKNAQLFRLVDALISDNAAKAPIDFVFVCGENGFPDIFKTNSEIEKKPRKTLGFMKNVTKLDKFQLINLVRTDVTELAMRELNSRMEQFNINAPRIYNFQTSDGALIAEEGNNNARVAYFHVLRGAKASATMVKYFPEVALAILIGNKNSWVSQIKKDTYIDELNSAKQRIFEILDKSPGFKNPANNDNNYILNVFYEIFPRTNSSDNSGDSQFEKLSEILGHKRFLLTIVSAAASEAACTTVLYQKPTPTTERFDAINAWIEYIKTTVSTKEHDERVDLILDHVLDFYRKKHDSEKSFLFEKYSLPLEEQDIDYNVIEKQLKRPLGWRLQLRILWHLALVGQPVEMDVLSRAPQVQEQARLILREINLESKIDFPIESKEEQKYIDILCIFAIKILVGRCLVFKIEPAICHEKAQPESNGTINYYTYRYALHRLVQRFIFKKLRSPYVEYPEIDEYSLSMWANQPDDLPRPHVEAAHDISELTAAWTGFPKDQNWMNKRSVFQQSLDAATSLIHTISDKENILPNELATITLPARMLSATLGVVRSVYSVGVVSRFHDFDAPGLIPAPHAGYFEQHRRQIRWLINNAFDLPKLENIKNEKFLLKFKNAIQAPFFDEELVWLYNECGLLSLAEGRLYIANGMFQKALQAARNIEPDGENGALWARIHLNLAVVDIERGRSRTARQYLEKIKNIPDEHPVIRLIAHGFIGLIEHLGGNLDTAELIYKDVIEELEDLGRSRAAAIFARHLAELYRSRGMSHINDAVAAIERSIANATRGGHEDILQLAKLARVRLVISGLLKEDKAQLQRDIDRIERYGKAMGMPRLIADTAFARAQFLLSLGETRHAARHVTTCLRIATLHDLKLRQVTALVLMARIYGFRNLPHAAEPLMARAFALADSCGYANARKSNYKKTTDYGY